MTLNLMLATILVLTLNAGAAAAQGTNAALSGTVTDATKAVVPGVSVTVENVATGVASLAISNEAGVYNFPGLQPGIYRVTGELPGFRKVVYNEVILEVAARVNLNFQIEIAPAAGDVVEVTAAVDTTLAIGTSSIGGMISGKKVQDLPLPARDALSLVFTQAGMFGGNVGGSRIGALNITRDGINIMDQHINQGLNPDTATINSAPTVIFNSVDIVQEVRVVTSPADAEFGRGSGQVQILTRSGTNEFHGSLFESHRNTALNANTWFNNLRGDPRNILIRNQFGATAGRTDREEQHVLPLSLRRAAAGDEEHGHQHRIHPDGAPGHLPVTFQELETRTTRRSRADGRSSMETPCGPLPQRASCQELNVFGRRSNRMRAGSDRRDREVACVDAAAQQLSYG